MNDRYYPPAPEWEVEHWFNTRESLSLQAFLAKLVI